MNNARITGCGNTTLMIGQLFDPNDLMDPTGISDPAEIPAHLFDRLGLLGACNDDAASTRRHPRATVEHERA